MDILSFVVKLREHDFDMFRVVEQTEKFIRCQSDHYDGVTFDKEDIVVGKEITAPQRLTIVEVTTEKSNPAAGRGVTYELLEAKAKIAQGDYVPNWDDNNPKYFPVFDMRNGGFAYSYTVSFTLVGSRFCFPSREEAKKFGVDNLELYRILYKG